MTIASNHPSVRLRLRASPNFASCLTPDGRPYVAKNSEPYVEYWLTERNRLLFAAFSARRGATIDGAIKAYLRQTRVEDSRAERGRLMRAIDEMRRVEVLLDDDGDESRYDDRIVDAYVTHRPLPPEVAAHVVARGRVGRQTRALDLAGGPGDLALALAKASDEVSLMDLSRGFLAAASRRAVVRGVKVHTIHDTCNRLMHSNDAYDVVTVSQALHWLDDVAVCRGICRVLRTRGSFFVIHSVIDMPDTHPLAYVLGNESILGPKGERSFVRECESLQRRLGLLFDALDARDIGERIVASDVAFYRQHRTMGAGYARAFLTSRHVEASGRDAGSFWADLDARCAATRAEDRMAVQEWGVLEFRRGGPRMDVSLDDLPINEIGCDAPVDDGLGPAALADVR